MQSCGKTKGMSTAQAREMKNNKRLTILRLQNVGRKEFGTIVYGVVTSPLICIFFSLIHWLPSSGLTGGMCS